MSMLLTIIVVSFKCLCAYGLGSTFMFLMSLFVAFVAVTHELLVRILICSLAPANKHVKKPQSVFGFGFENRLERHLGAEKLRH